MNVTSPLTLTIPSGQAVGTVNGVAARLYLCAINNAGTVELAVWNPLNATGPTLLGVNESGLVSTTAIAAAPSAQVLYSTTARTNVAVRVIGYIEISEATAGTWATPPTVLQIMGPGVRRTGDLIQALHSQTGAVATGTTTMADSDAIPQNTSGDQYMSLAITPTSAINRLLVQSTWNGTSNTIGEMTMALFQDTTANALSAISYFISQTGATFTFPLLHEFAAGTVSATTLKIRVGNANANTTTFNGEAGARTKGGVFGSFIRITEIFV